MVGIMQKNMVFFIVRFMTIPNKKNKGQSINDWLDKVSTLPNFTIWDE